MALSAAPATAATTSSAPVFSAQDAFFQTVGTDYTYVSSSVIPFSPSSSINQMCLTYDIPRLSSPTCVALNQLSLALKLKLEDKDGNEPPIGSMVSVTNLWPASLLRGVRLYIQEVSFFAVRTYMYYKHWAFSAHTLVHSCTCTTGMCYIHTHTMYLC